MRVEPKRINRRSGSSGTGREKRSGSGMVAWLRSDEEIEALGYRRLDRCPEVRAGVQCIAKLIGSIPIHLIANTSKGDTRVVNELSRKVDIEPNAWQTRSSWMQGIVADMMIYGNAVVIPMTEGRLIGDLVKVPQSACSYVADGMSYKIVVNGQTFDPRDVLHFVYNPDQDAPWKGLGLSVTLRDVVANLNQAAATQREFMRSKFSPSLIVQVDSTAEELSTREGRKKFASTYADTVAGEPWFVPAELMKVEQVKPLSLKDLAISETTTLDKKAVASIVGAPGFILGVGEYSQDEWNGYIQREVVTTCKMITQELTKKLLSSPTWYYRANVTSLYSWDIAAISGIVGGLYDRGLLRGDEARELSRLGLNPAGLNEFKALENYIPADKAGDQKKLKD